jgi:hypothetical protein
MKPVTFSVILALTLLPTSANAIVDEAGTFTVLGIGNMSCAEWSGARVENRNTDDSHIAWVHGYLTATNAYAPGPNNLTQAIGVEAAASWIDDYCSANPLDKVVEAAVRLVKALSTPPARQ